MNDKEKIEKIKQKIIVIHDKLHQLHNGVNNSQYFTDYIKKLYQEINIIEDKVKYFDDKINGGNKDNIITL